MTTSQNKNWIESKMSLDELSLWGENARFPDKYFNESEKKLISYFCTNGEDRFKIKNLAKAIVKDFDLPQLEKIIVYEVDEKNIVLEGNRRLTVYKLLNNPELAPNDSLKEFFIKLKINIDIKDDFLFDCLITKNEIEGFRYIERKHINGNNEVYWNETERTNHNLRRGKANDKEKFKSEIAKKIKKLDIPEELKEQVLGPGFVTNFWRIIDSSAAWKEYGFNMTKEGKLLVDDESFSKKLKVIILNILKKEDFSGNKIDSRTLNKNKDKEKYLDSITDDWCDKATSEIEKSRKNNIFGEKVAVISSGKNKRVKPKSTTRKNLIPKTCYLIINEKKINNIYRELRDDLSIDDSKNAVPNAAGVLFRVFLEISLDYYAKMNQYGFKKQDTIGGQKIPWVVQDLKNKGYEKEQFNNILKVSSSPKEKSYLAIDHFHEYVHSYTTQPTSSELKAKWDNLEEFFIILWESIQSKK